MMNAPLLQLRWTRWRRWCRKPSASASAQTVYTTPQHKFPFACAVLPPPALIRVRHPQAAPVASAVEDGNDKFGERKFSFRLCRPSRGSRRKLIATMSARSAIAHGVHNRQRACQNRQPNRRAEAMPRGGKRSTSFKPGVSGNPGGRPKKPATIERRQVEADAKGAGAGMRARAISTLRGDHYARPKGAASSPHRGRKCPSPVRLAATSQAMLIAITRVEEATAAHLARGSQVFASGTFENVVHGAVVEVPQGDRASERLGPWNDGVDASPFELSIDFCHNKASAVTVLTGASVVVTIASIHSMMTYPSLISPA